MYHIYYLLRSTMQRKSLHGADRFHGFFVRVWAGSSPVVFAVMVTHILRRARADLGNQQFTSIKTRTRRGPPPHQKKKNAKLLNLQEQSRPRNTITKGLKTPERGIGSAVLLRARQGGELIKALTLLGPFIYKQQSYRILPANQLAKEFIVPAPTKKDNKALVSTVPYWVSDSLILTYLCNPNHIAHNTGITFWHTGPHSSGNLEHQLLRLEFKHSYLRTQFLELATSTDPFWTLEGPPGDNGLPSFHHLSFAKEEIEFPILMDFTPVRTPSQNPNAGLKKLKL
jgi:hypothetical protein